MAAALIAASCGGGSDLVIGATTSLQDAGLLDELVVAFEEESDYKVAAVTPLVAGSGQVLELARRGEVDAVITHSPAAEERFMVEGHGVDRRPVMKNSFLLVGPPEDPARIAAARSPAEAFRLIAEAGVAFVSRGDGSGTNVRELAIWKQAGIDPSGRPWYQETAVGQGQSLLVASDKGAYTLVDSATFRVFQEKLELVAYVIDREVANSYSVMRVNPARHPVVNEEAALAFADFLTSPAGQSLIEDFGREEYGEPLFTPDAADRTATPTPVSTP